MTPPKNNTLALVLRNPWLMSAFVFYLAMVVFGSFKFLEKSFIWTFNDKFLHFCAYMVIAFLVYVGLNLPVVMRAIYSLAVAGSLGFVDEFTQILTNRDPSFDDWLSDVAGSIFIIAILALVHKAWQIWQMYRSGEWGIDPDEVEP